MGRGPIVRNYNPRTHKRCIKCRGWKARQNILDDDGNVIEKKGFGDHNSSDGLQSICFMCKGIATKHSRSRNVVARLRHHTATRCLIQLGEFAPPEFTKNMEDYLGYKIRTLVNVLKGDLREREGPTRKLRDALEEGYHIDHKHPLSSYRVVVDGVVDWEAFRECWAPTNLRAIPAQENLAKGAKVTPGV